MWCSDASPDRPAGIIRTDLVRRMMNPLDPFPDTFDRTLFSPYRALMMDMQMPPRTSPGKPSGGTWGAS